MPLRAKIQNAAFASAAPKMASQTEQDDPDDVLFGSIYGVRTIELNRPKKLNSLNGSMCRKIIQRLQDWQKSDLANVVIIAGAGEKAFCAGGDVAALAQWNKEGKEGQQRSSDYFALEYQLDHLIGTYPKPYVAYMDGITMGGGVGLSVHAPFRIATERTVFAMPETTIGFFPDVGGTFFLPRLDGYTGKYLALTSDRLKGVNVFYAGVATHYVHSSTLVDLTTRLSELRFDDELEYQERATAVNATIEEFAISIPQNEPPLLRGEFREAIDRCFAPDTVEGIIEALRKEERSGEQFSTWATNTLKTLTERSPTSLKVTARQMIAFKDTDFAEVLRREHQLASRFMAHPDFTEGVTARLIEKRAPKWQPATLAEVSDQDVDKMFLTEGKALELLNKETYTDYPLDSISGLPKEAAIAKTIRRNNFKTKAAVVEWYLREFRNKAGLKEKVTDALDGIATVEKGPEGDRVRTLADIARQQQQKQSEASRNSSGS